jgi:hypothetical protein
MQKYFIGLSLMLLLSMGQLAAQFSLPYELGEVPNLQKMSEGYDLKTLDDLELLDERVIEFAYDKNNALFEYLYVHEIRYVNSEDAIDRANKIYISGSRITSLESYDVRVILANGKVIPIGKDALKEGVNEEKNKVKYFAVSGAEKGSFIEYYYLVKRDPAITGIAQNFQGKSAKARVIFKIISPENLTFTCQSYNGFPKMHSDTSLVERHMIVADTILISAVYEEPFANEEANKKYLIYQLYFNTAKGKKNPYNYGIVSQNLYDNLCNKVTKDELKQVDKLLKLSNIKYAPDEEAKIRAIENYVKRNFNFVELNTDQLNNILTMVSTTSVNENGALKLFFQLFERLGIEQEIVVTSNRFNMPFDKEFESYSFLTDYLIYFPKLNKYMSPFNQLHRLGVVPSAHTENYGLFIRKVSVGDLNTGAGKIKFIPALKAEQNQNNLFITASFMGNNDSLSLDLKQELHGYYAANNQSYFDYINEEKTKEVNEGIVKTFNENVNILSVRTENKGGDLLMVKPLIVNSKLTGSHFIEKAGTKVMVKFGELIGPQSELYQEKSRIFPVENSYNRTFHREITLIIPEGYQVKNVAELNMKVQPFAANGDKAGFVATYTLEGNKLIVKSDEYYKHIHFTLAEYENFRSVINAAANYNKIILVLEKL